MKQVTMLKSVLKGSSGAWAITRTKVNQWTASIVEHSLTQLVKQGKPSNTL
uniref:Uncharacterized protein n=1 Tax=Anguilla anguilla TaxID=7936 RepID=A0A0E9VHU2_ANGAN